MLLASPPTPQAEAPAEGAAPRPESPTASGYSSGAEELEAIVDKGLADIGPNSTAEVSLERLGGARVGRCGRCGRGRRRAGGVPVTGCRLNALSVASSRLHAAVQILPTVLIPALVQAACSLGAFRPFYAHNVPHSAPLANIPPQDKVQCLKRSAKAALKSAKITCREAFEAAYSAAAAKRNPALRPCARPSLFVLTGVVALPKVSIPARRSKCCLLGLP